MKRNELGRTRTALRIGALVAILCADAARAQEEEARWTFWGSNEALIENFDVDGDRTNSPFPFDGTFWTDRLQMGLDYRGVPGVTLHASAEIAGADNPYLAEDGLLLSRFLVEYENGTTRVPLRLSAGDVFADLSRRTLQRQIRGVSVELQPEFQAGQHSIVFVSGNGEPSWSDTFDGSFSALRFHALSYLLENERGDRRLVANYVNARQEPGVAGAFPIPRSAARVQQIGSVYAEALLRYARIEGEVTSITGDDERPDGSGTNVNDSSFYAQMTGVSRGPFSWQLRAENNGGGFAPIGGVSVIADYRVGEGSAEFRLPRSLGNVRGRLQRIEQGFDGLLPRRDVEAADFGYDGRPFRVRRSLIVRLSSNWNDLDSAGPANNIRFQSHALDLNDRLGLIDATYRVTYRDSDSQATGSSSSALDHDLSLGRTFRFGDESAVTEMHLRGGLTHRRQEGPGEYRAVNPMIEASLRRGAHILRLHLGFLDQHFERALVRDLEYQTRRLVYSWARTNDALSVEVGNELREPAGTQTTESLRLALRYRRTFRHPFG